MGLPQQIVDATGTNELTYDLRYRYYFSPAGVPLSFDAEGHPGTESIRYEARFEYAPRGILDQTHLRFFTRRSARRFIEDCGFEVVRQETTMMPVELALGVSAGNRAMKLANRILRVFTRLMPGLLGYQFVFVARPR